MQTGTILMQCAHLSGFLVLFAACGGPSLSIVRDAPGVTIMSEDGVFATVHATARPRPFVWPVTAPGGTPVTRSYPMAREEGEQEDHPHHRSLWFAHGSVNGFDFWHTKAPQERIVHVATKTSQVSANVVEVESDYAWKVENGRVIMRERRALRFEDHGDHRCIEVAVTLRATEGDVVLGDTKEGTFALRLHPSLRVDGKVASGTLINSEGLSGKGVWGKRARWVHDYGPVDGAVVGVAIFDHPENLRHPTWWHARTYGLVAANPFGVHHFEQRQSGAGDYVIKHGDELALRYRAVIHSGAWDADRVEAAWRAWAR